MTVGEASESPEVGGPPEPLHSPLLTPGPLPRQAGGKVARWAPESGCWAGVPTSRILAE